MPAKNPQFEPVQFNFQFLGLPAQKITAHQAIPQKTRSDAMRINQAIKIRTILACALLLIVVSAMNSANASVVVIVSKDSSVSSLTQSEVKQLFLKQNKYFPGGNVALPLDQRPTQKIKRSFYQSVARMNSSQWLAYWSKLVFTGKMNPPRLLGDDQDVLKLVASDPQFIGYIDSTSLNEHVKVVYSAPL